MQEGTYLQTQFDLMCMNFVLSFFLFQLYGMHGDEFSVPLLIDNVSRKKNPQLMCRFSTPLCFFLF